MSNQNKGIAYDKAKPELVEKVKGVVAESEKHTYSVSRVYAAYNEVFELREVPQSCSSCLRARVGLLKKWLNGYTETMKVAADATANLGEALGNVGEAIKGASDTAAEEGKEGASDQASQAAADPNDPEYAAPTPGVIRTPMQEGAPIDFTPSPEDSNKGTALYADGKPVKAGTYVTAQGATIAVQPGGKATFKPKEEDLT